MRLKRRYKATIVYHTGVKLHVKAEELSVTYSNDRDNARITGMEYAGLTPAPVWINVSAIESIWNGHV